MKPFREVTDAEWERVAALLPELRGKRSRARLTSDSRAVFNGVLWVLFTRSVWPAMPAHYPSYRTCYGRYYMWLRAGVFGQIADAMAGSLGYDLNERVRSRKAASGSLRRPDAIPSNDRVGPVNPGDEYDLYAVLHRWTRCVP